ncbi:MAG: Cys-rich protein [Spirochaetales bacterium]|nr:Cys-rich protein [Spirochaetales bacterium]
MSGYPQKLLHWSPMLAFACFVVAVVFWKYLGPEDTEQPAGGLDEASCQQICERFSSCVEVLSTSPQIQSYMPAVERGCFSGCMKRGNEYVACFDNYTECNAIAACFFALSTGQGQ